MLQNTTLLHLSTYYQLFCMAYIAKQDNNLILYKANLKDKQTAISPLPLSLVGKEGKGRGRN